MIVWLSQPWKCPSLSNSMPLMCDYSPNIQKCDVSKPKSVLALNDETHAALVTNHKCMNCEADTETK